jgi:hypothetical protein
MRRNEPTKGLSLHDQAKLKKLIWRGWTREEAYVVYYWWESTVTSVQGMMQQLRPVYTHVRHSKQMSSVISNEGGDHEGYDPLCPKTRHYHQMHLRY